VPNGPEQIASRRRVAFLGHLKMGSWGERNVGPLKTIFPLRRWLISLLNPRDLVLLALATPSVQSVIVPTSAATAAAICRRAQGARTGVASRAALPPAPKASRSGAKARWCVFPGGPTAHQRRLTRLKRGLNGVDV
jgi:hypothetical protein